MGQQVSTDIRSRLEHYTLEELLSDDKYIEELQRHLPGLPKRSHTNLANFLALWEDTLSKDSHSAPQPNPPPKAGNSSPKDRNSRTSRLGSLWSIQSKDISIPNSVAEVLKQDHCNILRQSSKNGVGLQSPVDHYEYTCTVETGRTLDRILWRFLTTFYYDLISELDAAKLRFSATKNGGVAFVVAIICQSGKHDPDTVRQKVMGWVTVGRRYRGFMNALCAGCLVLFPEQTSDLVWEQYVPIKGDMFTKVIQFLQGLGMVDKCEEEGWNDLSDKILHSLREPFQFQPGRRTLDSRALPTLAANRVIKTKRKKGTTSVRRQQSFARDLTAHQTPPEKSLPLVVRQSYHTSRGHRSETQHETHGRLPRSWSPQAPAQRRASAPNGAGQWHLATNHQDDRLLSSQVSVNDRARDPLSDISLNAPNIYPSGTDSAQSLQNVTPGLDQRFVSPPGGQHGHCHVDQGQRIGKSISDTTRPERTDISTISALLNHDNNTPATTPATTQGSLEGSEDQQSGAAPVGVGTTLLRAIRFEKHTLQRIVLERPTDILGGIWFGSPQGYPPCVLLRLPRALDIIVKPSGQEVYVPGPSPGTSSTATRIYLIKLECFKQMIQRDGFGVIFWNECGEEAFVTMEVIDAGLAEDFIRGAVPPD